MDFKLKSFDFDDLQEIKADIELDEFMSNELIEFDEKQIRSKERLLASIDETRSKYLSEASSGEGEHNVAFYELTDKGVNLLMNHFFGFILMIAYTAVIGMRLLFWWKLRPKG